MIPGFQTPPHILTMIAELEAVERGDQDRLMVHMPPRHGKTLLCSILFPAWYLGWHPERKVILASYGAELAHDNGRACRNLVMSEAYRDCFNVRVTEDSAAAHRWHTDKGGGLIATGIPGPISGRGASLLVIDDALRGAADAQSETVRESIWRWWQSDARTRLEPPSAVVMPCTRWHEDDLAGRLLAQDAPGASTDGLKSSWRVLSLPAIYTRPGASGPDMQETALWPDRYPLSELQRIRREIGESQFAALYQQQPSPETGHIFRWFPEYSEIPPLRCIYIPLDTAYTAQERSDYTAWSIWGSDGAKLYLLEAGRCQEETPTAERMVRMAYQGARSRYDGLPVSVLVRKRVAIDRIAAQHLRSASIPVVEVDLPPVGTKEALANLVVNRMEGQTVLVPQPSTGNGWLDPWLHEHRGFPTSAHDDWVETTLIVLHYTNQQWRGPWPEAYLHSQGRAF